MQPKDVTVCRTQTTEAEFTCVVDRNDVSITAIDWQILVGEEFQLVQEMPRHVIESSITADIITGVLTVTDVMMNDNSNQYRCSPTETTMSDIVTLTVLGKTTYVSSSTTVLVYVYEHKIFARILNLKKVGIEIKSLETSSYSY